MAKSIKISAKYDPCEASTRKKEMRNSRTEFIIDGGSLLHKIPCVKNENYSEIFERYAKYLMNKYGFSTTIVFDGYDGTSTKDLMHLKSCRSVGREVFFSSEMKITSSKEEFLSFTNNKKRIITALSAHLKKGFKIINAEGDADLKIVETAVLSLKKTETVVLEKIRIFWFYFFTIRKTY